MESGNATLICNTLLDLIAMSQSSSVTDLRESHDATYTSSSLARFAWDNNPLGEHGFLQVEFQEGGKYLYIGVPKHLERELRARAQNPEHYEDSVGQFFYKNIRNQFEREGRDYTRMNHL